MQTFTLEEAAALVANKYRWHEGAQKTLLKQLLDAAKDGTLIVRHPHTDLPYRPKQCREFYETVGVSDLNRYFEAACAPVRLDDGETMDSPFETEWWNLIQVLAWVYRGDRALVRDGPGTPPLRLIVEGHNGACYPSFELAQDAVIEALQMGKLSAYGLDNNAGDLKEIPQLLWADLKFWWDPEHAGPRDRSRLRASRWYALRFKRKAILALWPDPLESLTMADAHNRTPSDMRTGAAIATRKDNKNDRRKKLKLFIDDVYTALDKDGYALAGC